MTSENLTFLNESEKPDNEPSNNITFDFNKYKSIIYTAIFYIFGLFIGAYFYKIAPTDTLDALLKPEQSALLRMFISNFCMYFSLYVLVVFLGFCLIGYPIINIIPTVIGLTTGLKCAYLYVNYSVKGIGYSLVMLVPYAALFLTVIAFAIKLSTSLSKQIISITKKSDEHSELDLKPYIRKYLVLALCIVVTSLAETCLTSLLFTVVTI